MSDEYIYLMIIVCSVTTYLVRMLPMMLVQTRISSPFIKDCLSYMPYAVLAAMTIPQIFYSTGSVLQSAVGAVVALIVAFCGRSLIEVALSASIGAYAVYLIMNLI